MICRMCLLESLDGLNIFDHSRTHYQFQIAKTIAQHFWFEPTKDDPISNMICNACWSKIEDFHIYYVSVEEAQWRLPKILSIKGESSAQTVYLKVETASNEEIDKTEHRKASVDIEKVDVSVLSFDKELATFTDPINVDCSLSDDEILASLKSIDRQALKLEDDGTVGLNIFKLQNNSKQSNEIEIIDNMVSNDSTEKVIQKKRSRKKKSENVIPLPSVESDNRKKVKKSDDDIAQQITLKCDLCISEFKIFSELQRHYRAVHESYVACCSIKFRKRGEFLDHISQHVNPECFKCNECDKVYANRRSFQCHMTIHQPVDTTVFQCDQCSRRFAKSYLLNQHKRNIHAPNAANSFSCEECGKGYNKKIALQSHRRRIHENAYTQMCHICAKVIRGKSVFAKHQLEHAGISEPKQQCQECGVWLKNTFRLKLHMKIHAEIDNDHICNICGKSLTSRVALRSHIRYVHSVKRQHKCSYCDKAFKELYILKEHMTTHTGVVLYTCPHCPKTFNCKSNMHTHRKRMHRKEWEEARKYPGISSELLKSREDKLSIGNEINSGESCV